MDDRAAEGGVTIGVTVVTIFILGLLIGGVRLLEVPTFDRAGKRMDAGLLDEVRSKPWSIAQVMTGPIGIASGAFSIYASRPSPVAPFDPPGDESHSRVNELGVLYTAVAGMLNLLAIIDCSYRAGKLAENS